VKPADRWLLFWWALIALFVFLLWVKG